MSAALPPVPALASVAHTDPRFAVLCQATGLPAELCRIAYDYAGALSLAECSDWLLAVFPIVHAAVAGRVGDGDAMALVDIAFGVGTAARSSAGTSQAIKTYSVAHAKAVARGEAHVPEPLSVDARSRLFHHHMTGLTAAEQEPQPATTAVAVEDSTVASTVAAAVPDRDPALGSMSVEVQRRCYISAGDQASPAGPKPMHRALPVTTHDPFRVGLHAVGALRASDGTPIAAACVPYVQASSWRRAAPCDVDALTPLSALQFWTVWTNAYGAPWGADLARTHPRLYRSVEQLLFADTLQMPFGLCTAHTPSPAASSVSPAYRFVMLTDGTFVLNATYTAMCTLAVLPPLTDCAGGDINAAASAFCFNAYCSYETE